MTDRPESGSEESEAHEQREAGLGLGSNQGDRCGYLVGAIRQLAQHPQIDLVAISSVYATPPWGPIAQPDFLNAAIAIRTTLAPADLLAVCKATEGALGRQSRERWGPREIDIDILVYDDLHTASDALVVPHARLHERLFALVPLAEATGRSEYDETIRRLAAARPDEVHVLDRQASERLKAETALAPRPPGQPDRSRRSPRRPSLQLARFPRRRYTPGPTPIQPLKRLSKALGGPDIYIKRDDLTGLAAGGNKTRKLEFLVAEALSQGADTLITVGAPQSNHCRLTLAAAAHEGLKCRLLIEERVPGTYSATASGNNFLFNLLGAEHVEMVPAGTDLAAKMAQMADAVRSDGGRPYVIPGGGSNPLGALGYVVCAQELLAQSLDMGIAFDRVVSASGSAGTHAGLSVGLHLSRFAEPVVGVNVRRPRAEQEGNVHKLAVQTAELLGIDAPPREAIIAYDDWVGPGYSLPTPEMIEAVRMLASMEGILLDPVYTGKAMAGLIAMARSGAFKKGEQVLFIHTGGSPGLFAYETVLRT